MRQHEALEKALAAGQDCGRHLFRCGLLPIDAPPPAPADAPRRIRWRSDHFEWGVFTGYLDAAQQAGTTRPSCWDGVPIGAVYRVAGSARLPYRRVRVLGFAWQGRARLVALEALGEPHPFTRHIALSAFLEDAEPEDRGAPA